MLRVRILIAVLLILLSGTLPFLRAGESAYSVVVHEENPITSISREKLRRIFTGKIRFWEDHRKIVPIYIDGEHLGRFAEEVHLSKADLQKIWVRLSLQGITEPPRRFDRQEEAFAFLASHRGGIGIFPASLPESLPGLKRIALEP